jgi:hypothetical protein
VESDRRQISEHLQARRIQTFKGVKWILMEWLDKGYWFPHQRRDVPPVATKKETLKARWFVPKFPSPSHVETYARKRGLT